MPNPKEQSRGNYLLSEDPAAIRIVEIGCLQRIADALEAIAKQLAHTPSAGEAQGDLVDQFRAKSPEHDRLYREEKAKVDAAEFAAWLCEQMPAGTVIADPKWWAPRIWREAQRGGG